ncbi:hypothetical protein B9Z55_021333 [Caenorhabditis nigoni]|uniref:Serpentine receptor class gamma n=1 Tax=Caenorhabditis nigoni TaxID=1611254 RepID=A0A2G5TRN7_9PELO|nr:hypothetical protein B9Z55_021333 [Caenorhabditis nigoni]
MSDNSNTSSLFDVLQGPHSDQPVFVQVSLISVAVTSISLQLVFPFYAYVNRVNRERDKNTLVYPLIDHFYGMMKKTQAIFVLMYAMAIYTAVKRQKVSFLCLLIVLCFYILIVFTQVFQFFLMVLAIQKFILYFSPSSQKYIIPSRKNMQNFIRFAYYFFISKEIISLILYYLGDNTRGNKIFFYLPYQYFDQIFFAAMNITFFASALLYIPIFISVRKMSNLRTVQESKPQIYIFWQTMTALIAKIVHTSIFTYTYASNIFLMIALTRVFDVFSVPVIIQISYLTCNRQNLITLLSSFKGRRLIRELLTTEVTSAVGPDPRRHMI